MGELPLSRRNFVGDLMVAGAAFSIVPRHVLGRGFVPPSDTVNVACIGVGGMGASDVKGMSDQNLVAFADVDWNSAERTFQLYPKTKRYKDWREMLDKEAKNIDAVTVSTPDHSHAAAGMAALRLGKHTYIQKPLARTVGEVRVLKAEAARRPKQATQMGNQGHSHEGIRQIREWVEAGAIGTVREVRCWTNRPIWPQGIRRPTEAHNVPPTMDWNLWLGPAADRPYHPSYAPFNWRGWWDFGTGAMGDMACHIMDAAMWVNDLRYPTRITPESTTLFAETAPKASRITYEFPARNGRAPLLVTWRDGSIFPPRPHDWPDVKAWPFDDSGQLWIGDKGTLTAGTYGENPRLSNEEAHAALIANPPAPKFARTRGVYGEWVDAIKAGTQPGSNFASSAGPLTEMITLGNLAVRMGHTLELNTETGEITNVSVPSDWIMPAYRPGWSL